MPLLTYARYQQLGGELTEAAFSPLEMRASKVVDALTHGRARRDLAPARGGGAGRVRPRRRHARGGGGTKGAK